MKIKITLLFLFFGVSLFAQGRWTVFGGPGYAYYQGDVAHSVIPNGQTMKISALVGASYMVFKHVGIRYHLSGSVLHGSDLYASSPDLINRGLSFKTNLLQGGFSIKINRIIGKPKTKFINYIFLGTDLAVIDVLVTPGSKPMVPEGDYSRYQIINPFGIGLGYWFSKRYGLTYEATMHISSTDYLDGISYNGKPKGRDTYISNTVVLVARLGKLNYRKRPSGRYKFHQFEIPYNY